MEKIKSVQEVHIVQLIGAYEKQTTRWYEASVTLEDGTKAYGFVTEEFNLTNKIRKGGWINGKLLRSHVGLSEDYRGVLKTTLKGKTIE